MQLANKRYHTGNLNKWTHTYTHNVMISGYYKGSLDFLVWVK